MSKGSNPASHNNKPTIPDGRISKITLPSGEWDFLKIIGSGNQSKGCREVLRMIQVIANRNWTEAAQVLNCESLPDAIAMKLTQLFPDITYGNKTQDDIVQELALGECKLQQKEGEVIRVVNLVTIEIEHEGQLLVEAFQELHNGKRVNRCIVGVAEKVQHGETPKQAARRGISEELEGITPEALEATGFNFDPNKVSKYRGIQSFAAKHMFKATLKLEDIRERYEEIREGVRTVFVWATPIYANESGFLNFGDGGLATKEQYELCDRSPGSVFEALAPGENVLFSDGVYQLDEELDLVPIQ